MSPLHVVVVGHGMVGARFAEEVRKHDPEGHRVRLTILAAEPRPAYNRVLLPNLLSGVMKEEDFTATVVAGLPVVPAKEIRPSQNGSVLHPDAPMSLRVGATVIGIDPATKTVLVESTGPGGPLVPPTRDQARPGTQARNGSGAAAAAIERVGYDVLVLATGARPAVPPLPGLLDIPACARLPHAAPVMVDSSAHGDVENYPPPPGQARPGRLTTGPASETPLSPERPAESPPEARPVTTGNPAPDSSATSQSTRTDIAGATATAESGADGAASIALGAAQPLGFTPLDALSSDRPQEHSARAAGLRPSSGPPLAAAARSSVFPAPPGRPGDAEKGAEGRGATGRSADRLAADVAALHSLADARHIAAFAQAARRTGGRVAVLGGGVLGLEAARALTARGTAVTVVHRGAHLMDRQLDAAAGRVLADAMRRTGVEVTLGVGAARWEPGRGLWLANGELVKASGLVLCTGTVPGTELARDAGLRLTEAGAVTVDDTLATSLPGIYAIGDCAGHPGAAGGLVQPGWEQAAVLASRLTGAAPKARYRGSGAVTRLKAAGIELTAVGASLAEPGGDADVEVLRFEDPARERYGKLVLSEDRVVGAVLIGLPDAAAGIVQLYDRDAPAPADRLALLLGRALPPEAAGVSGPGALPDYAVVCRCNMVTKGQLRDAWYRGACGRAALSAATRAATGCGTCGDDLDAMTTWLAETDPSQAAPTSPTSPADKPAGETGQEAEKEPALR